MSDPIHSEATFADDPFAKLDEYARWGGPNSTYQWALDEIIRLRKVLQQIADMSKVSGKARIEYGSLADAAALAREALDS